MSLGAFSISHVVNDIRQSKQFYENLEIFEDVKTIQMHLKNCGIKFTLDEDPNYTKPAYIALKSPDMNSI